MDVRSLTHSSSQRAPYLQLPLPVMYACLSAVIAAGLCLGQYENAATAYVISLHPRSPPIFNRIPLPSAGSICHLQAQIHRLHARLSRSHRSPYIESTPTRLQLRNPPRDGLPIFRPRPIPSGSRVQAGRRPADGRLPSWLPILLDGRRGVQGCRVS